MATIWQLNQRINSLNDQNKILQKEFEEYNHLKSDLSNLVEAHLSRKNQDRSLVGGESLLPSNCAKTFKRKFTAQLNNGSDSKITGHASLITANIIKKQMSIQREISSNESEIRSCRWKISQLKSDSSNE